MKINVVVADSVALTVDYTLYKGIHGEEILDVVKACYSDGSWLNDELFDAMNWDIAVAVEEVLGLA